MRRSALGLGTAVLLTLATALSGTPGYAGHPTRPGDPVQGAPRLTFPDPAQVGMHNVGLVYHRPGRTAQSFVPYVNRVDATGQPVPGEPLFDAFTLLTLTTPTGVSTDYGQSRSADWLATLDYWFGTASTPGDLDLLDQAVASTGGSTPVRRQITVMLPYMSPEVHDFGDVDGDGTGEDLGNAADREQVARWYSLLVAQRFQAAGLRHLDLWGMYRMREDITAWEQPVIGRETAGVHAAGLKIYWIPYFDAPGWDRSAENGFDAAALQPSYSFRSWLDGGSVTRSRLRATAELAATEGLGVEVEVRGCAAHSAEHAILRQYLADGNAFGYQQGFQAYFLGADLPICGTAAGAHPASRQAYDALADYVRNAAAPDPDLTPAWQWTGFGSLTTGTATLSAATTAPGVRVDLDEPGDAWRGSAVVATWDGSAWRDRGWSVRGSRDQLAGRSQSFSVPLAVQVPAFTRIRITLRTAADSPVAVPAIVAASLDPALPITVQNSPAVTAYAQESPAPPPPSYPDSTGRELTDSAYTTTGWTSARNVGWQFNPGRAAVVVDLGTTRTVGGVRLRANGGQDAGVNWPRDPSVLLGTSQAALAPSGTGALPAGLRALPGRQPVVTGRHSSAVGTTAPDSDCTDTRPWMCVNLDGYLDFTTGAPVQTRWLTVYTELTGWAMLSEIEVYAGTPGASTRIQPAGYRLRSLPGFDRSGQSQYADDGRRLTDGTVADAFLPAQLTGWPADRSGTLRLDIDPARSFGTLRLWGIDDASSGILPAPETTSARVTYDGTTWVDFPMTAAMERPRGQAAVLRLTGKARVTGVRAVRVTVPAHGQGWQWTMLSELTAE